MAKDKYLSYCSVKKMSLQNHISRCTFTSSFSSKKNKPHFWEFICLFCCLKRNGCCFLPRMTCIVTLHNLFLNIENKTCTFKQFMKDNFLSTPFLCDYFGLLQLQLKLTEWIALLIWHITAMFHHHFLNLLKEFCDLCAVSVILTV